LKKGGTMEAKEIKSRGNVIERTRAKSRGKRGGGGVAVMA
jgi:hypothetical protein